MPTTSNFGWTTPADTDLVKDGAAAIRTLGNGIDTSLVDLKGGTTGQVLSKASNTDLDYTWTTPNVGDITEVQGGTGITVTSGTGPIPSVAIDSSVATLTGSQTLTNKTISASSNTLTGVINNTLTTTTGDIIYASSANTPARLGIGSTGQVLTVSGGIPSWATAASGGDFTFISKTSVSAVSTANFNNLFSSTYDNYLIVISNFVGSTNNELHWRMRTSTTNAQSSYFLAATGYGSGGAANNMSESNQNEMRICPPPTANDYLTAYVWVSNPYLAKYTTINFTAWGDNGSVFVARNGAGNHRQNTSYDGISFGLYGGGNITCDVTCYGIKKS